MRFLLKTLLLPLALLSAFVQAAEVDIDDAALAAKIQRAFDNNELYEGALVRVDSVRGFILLTGQVLSEEARAKATNTVVFASQDIRRIINELQVVDAVDTGSADTDAALRQRIVAALEAWDADNAEKITVLVHRGTAYLLGALTSEQAGTAADRASRVEGLSNIRTGFEVVAE